MPQPQPRSRAVRTCVRGVRPARVEASTADAQDVVRGKGSAGDGSSPGVRAYQQTSRAKCRRHGLMGAQVSERRRPASLIRLAGQASPATSQRRKEHRCRSRARPRRDGEDQLASGTLGKAVRTAQRHGIAEAEDPARRAAQAHSAGQAGGSRASQGGASAAFPGAATALTPQPFRTQTVHGTRSTRLLTDRARAGRRQTSRASGQRSRPGFQAGCSAGAHGTDCMAQGRWLGGRPAPTTKRIRRVRPLGIVPGWRREDMGALRDRAERSHALSDAPALAPGRLLTGRRGGQLGVLANL